MIYVFEIKKTDEGYIAYIPDVDIETKPQETEEMACQAFMEGFAGAIELKYRKKKQPIPLPNIKDGEYGFKIPIKLQLRILLWNAMLDKHVSQTQLAEKLGISRAYMNQFFITDNVSVEKFEEALEALGYDVDVSLIKCEG